MKRVLPVIAIIMLIILAGTNNAEASYIIPKEAIRLRVIANSNTPYDQYIKSLVKVNLEEKIKTTMEESSISNARTSIKNNLPIYNDLIKTTLDKQNYQEGFNLNYGENYFPEKEYKGVKYEAGNYESLVVTLGEGKGDNWWCVLFPPLCSLEVEESSNVEYRIYVKDTFEKYLSK